MNHALARTLYAALGNGDRPAVERLLAPGFRATFTDSLPFGIGGTHEGVEAIDGGWWAIGRAFALTAEPREFIDAVDGRLLVLGVYAGRARHTGSELHATFAHLWAADAERLTSLIQFTDSARWLSALGTTADPDHEQAPCEGVRE